MNRNRNAAARSPEILSRLRFRWLCVFLLFALALAATSQAAGTLKVMHQGLGTGGVVAVSGASINCGTICDETFAAAPVVELQAAAVAGSSFVGWRGDCEAFGMATSCSVTMSADRSVRAEFRRDPDFVAMPMNPTLTDIGDFLADYPDATTPGHFLRALNSHYKESWLFMTRSESLQTGTSKYPRIILPSDNARSVFTIALAPHASYPGSHPNAVEFMQWDATEKTFRFHEIVMADIPASTQMTPTGPVVVPGRARGVHANDPRCTRCHSTRNIPNPDPADRGTSIPTGTPPVLAKNKPNWDSYDNWAGAMPFNSDTIAHGSVEAAAFRQLTNPWTWRDDVQARQVIEQLALHGSGFASIPRAVGGARDATPIFSFDGGSPPATEPAPVGNGTPVNVNYSFDSLDSAAVGTPVVRAGPGHTLTPTQMPFTEPRGQQFFRNLGQLNRVRIGHEVARHRFATGGVPLDVRPVALAIAKSCLRVNESLNRVESRTGYPPLTVDQTFFRDRHRIVSAGMGINELVDNTQFRRERMPIRKANIQKLNLDRSDDVYLFDPLTPADAGLIATYGAATSQGISTSMARLRQEVFRRSTTSFINADITEELEGLYADLESYEGSSDKRLSMFRFFLEPLGVSVDKWSMSVRGRSRTYTFADSFAAHMPDFITEIEASLSAPGDGYPGLTAYTCTDLIPAVNSSLSALPTAVPPTFTDVQRVFNKSCIECHGGLGYPPFTKFLPVNYINFAEEEDPPSGDRLLQSHGYATALTSNALDASNLLWTRITASGENCGDFVSVMPCGGPPLTGPDINTIERWIQGGRPNTHGDPHIRTIDGTHYDFQSAGEFTLLRGESIEIQARHTPVETASPLPPNAHTGLSSCASINTAAAIRVGTHRVTYQPNISGQPDPSGMQLRVNGKLVGKLGPRGMTLGGGGRILPTTAPGGIQIEYPGGADIVLTPNWWPHQQLWYLDIDVRYARANFGIMGAIAPRNWLPALPDNSWLGQRPAALSARYNQIYGQFADAWRVTNTTTLFDYAPGKSTASYTLKSWPKFRPTECSLPRPWAPPVAPQQPIALDAARKICGGIVDAVDFGNCVTDVSVTGEEGFANVYKAGERIQRNQAPRAPELQVPRNLEEGFADTVDFAWSPAQDRDGGRLSYLHCVWRAGERLDYGRHCRDIPARMYFTTASGLERNSTYYWKLVIDDGQGATVSSEIRHFKTRR